MDDEKIQKLKKVAEDLKKACDAEFDGYSKEPATISDIHNLATQVYYTLLEFIKYLENS